MTTVGLELTNFIDPGLTWKTVSRGRNTSRRSRRSASKNIKMSQEQGKKSPIRVNGAQVSESEKSDITIHGRRFGGNIEHIPIKKRRFILRSPSPPPQSPNSLEESKGQDSGHSTTNQHKCSNAIKPNGSVSDINNEKNILKSPNRVQGSCEDFSGIAILAAAACSGGLDNLADDAGRSQMDDIPKREHNESMASATGMEKSIACFVSPDSLRKDIVRVKEEEGSLVVCPNSSFEGIDRLENNSYDVGRTHISKFAGKEKESVASATSTKENVECLQSPDSLEKQPVCVEEDSRCDLPKDSTEIAHKTEENSGASQDSRLHWDLNIVMDEWDHPLDDTDDGSSMHLVGITTANIVDSENMKDMEGCEPCKGCETIDSGKEITIEPLSRRDDSLIWPEFADFTSRTLALRTAHCFDASSALGMCNLNEGRSPCNAMSLGLGTSNGVKVQPKVVDTGAVIDHSLSLGLNGTKILEHKETDNRAALGDRSEVAEVNSPSGVQIEIRPQKHEIDFLPLPLAGNASWDIKNENCEDMDYSKERNALDENENKVGITTGQSKESNPLGGDICLSASLGASGLVRVSCEVNNLNCRTPEAPKPRNFLDNIKVEPEDFTDKPANSHSLGSENQLVGLKNSGVPHCSSMSEDMIALSATTGSETVVAEGIEVKPAVPDASRCDSLVDVRSGAPVPQTPDCPLRVDSCKEAVNSPPVNHSDIVLPGNNLHGVGVCVSHVSNEESSQLTENNEAVVELEGDYDSHLEDGELRESVGNCWENTEGEDGETEHVDYDSDNRGGVVFLGVTNNSVELSGEVLAGECEKQSCRSDNFSSADDQPIPHKSIEENCSLQVQGCSSTADAMEAVHKREHLVLNACAVVKLRGRTDPESLDVDHKDGRRSGVESDCIGKEVDNDAVRNAGDASASRRELQSTIEGQISSESKSADSIKRSRWSNFDSLHHTNGSDESLARGRSSLPMDQSGGRSWNLELKSVVANSATEENEERTIRSSDDTLPGVCKPRIIPTSRNGYHLISGSTGDRDDGYGTEMGKVRDNSPPDNDARSRFNRFSNGITRGFREGHRRSGMFNEAAKSAGSMFNHFGKRERSFSPVDERVDRFPRSHRKSPPSLRTRSPDFRSEARMGRPRPPYQPASHAAEDMRERRSPVRMFSQGHRFDAMSSPGRLRSDDCMRPMVRPVRFHDTTTSGRGHNYEDIDDYRRKPLLPRGHRRSRSRSRSCSPDFRSVGRMGTMRLPYQASADHIRDRRSPVRVFRSGPRYDNGGLPGRLRSDECLRPMMRPFRCPDTAHSNRGHDYNNGEEYRRNPRNIFERIHPIRHYDVDGDVRRCHYDEEEMVATQNFRRNEGYVRGGDRRPVEMLRGNNREERGNLRYNNSERMFYSGPKQFGAMRDFDEDGVPRRGRP